VIDKLREQFEKWAGSRSMDLAYRNYPGVGQFYECPRTLLALESWQASRDSLVIELPVSFADGGDIPAYAVDRFQEAVKAAGVRTK
jgi:hypothetical protein